MVLHGIADQRLLEKNTGSGGWVEIERRGWSVNMVGTGDDPVLLRFPKWFHQPIPTKPNHPSGGCGW